MLITLLLATTVLLVAGFLVRWLRLRSAAALETAVSARLSSMARAAELRDVEYVTSRRLHAAAMDEVRQMRRRR